MQQNVMEAMAGSALNENSDYSGMMKRGETDNERSYQHMGNSFTNPQNSMPNYGVKKTSKF